MTQPNRREFLAGLAAGVFTLHASGLPQLLAATPPTHTEPGSDIPRRKLGQTGLSASLVGLGGFHIGVPPAAKDGVALVRSALDRGINFLDNSWDYHDGESEKRMCQALRDGYRQKAILMTKLDGRTAKSATAQLEDSLKRLQTDVIDLVQVHEVIRFEDPDRVFADDGAIGALQAAQKAGKLRFIGFTGHKDPEIHLKMLELADQHGFRFDTVQMPLNVMDVHYRSFGKKVLPRLVEKGIGVLGMKSIGDGEILKAGVVTAPECLRYSMSLPTSVVITGCDRMEILDQALEVARTFKPMTHAEVAALLQRTQAAGRTGKYEVSKTTNQKDSTAAHPQWLG